MAAPKDYYKILEITETADAAAIRAAYRKLARKYHPDVSGKIGEERFKDINEAHEVLSNPKKRREYDQMRRNFANRKARSQGPGYQRVSRDWDGFDVSDFGSIFEDLFSGSNTTKTQQRPKPDTPEESLVVTLEQVASGATVPITVSQIRPCSTCHGADPNCTRCGGLGQIMEPQRFEVKVPAGVEDGTVLRVGTHARLRIQVAPHPRFQRQKNDLVGRLMVTVPVAASGGQVTVTPLTGEPVALTIPAHTNQGKVLRLRGLGLPDRASATTRGDLLLEVTLRFPEPFSSEDDRLYEQLKALHHESGGDVHAPR